MTIVDEIKDRIDIVEFVGRRVPLKKAGRTFKGLCPFHAEKTPSFAVFPDTQGWFCFGCGAGGDVFNFVMQLEGWDFHTTLEHLAQQAGVELRPMTPERAKEIQKQREYEDALGVAGEYLAQQLPKTDRALAYARTRAWSDEMLLDHGVGYADGSSLPALGNARAQTVVEAMNRWAGSVGGALIYAHRVNGRTVYLSGRSIEGKSHYNPPAVAQTGELLAGPRQPFFNARCASNVSELVVVEGQGCSLSLAGWDIPAVALAGSGLSRALGSRLRRHVKKETTIYAVPDGNGRTDLFGLVEAVGPQLHIATLPDGVDDVNDYARSGATAADFRALLDDAHRATVVVVVEDAALVPALVGRGVPAVATGERGLPDDMVTRLKALTKQGVDVCAIQYGPSQGLVDGLAEAVGPLVRVAHLPDGVADAAAWVRRATGEELRTLLAEAPGWLDLRIDHLAQARAAEAESLGSGLPSLPGNALYYPAAPEVALVRTQADAKLLAEWDIPALVLDGTGGGPVERLRQHVAHDPTLYVVTGAGNGSHTLADLAGPAGPLFHVVALPQHVDGVSDWVRQGGTADDFRALLERAPTWLALEIDRVAATKGRQRPAALRGLFGHLSRLDPFTQAQYRDLALDKLQITRSDFNAYLKAVDGDEPSERREGDRDRQEGLRDLFGHLVSLDLFALTGYQEQVTETLGIPPAQFNRLLKAARAEAAAGQRDGHDRERYVVEDGRLCVVRYGRTGDRITEPLCNFTAEVVEDVGRDDGATVTRQFAIVGRLADGRSLPLIHVDAAKFGPMSWIGESWGVQAVLSAGWRARDQLREAIQLRSRQARVSHVYTHTGWRILEGRRVYLHAGGALGMEGVAVELDGPLARYLLPDRPEDLLEAVCVSLRLLKVAPPHITIPLWSLAHLAPLTEIASLDAVPWPHGATGTLKSSLSAVFMCYYGEFAWNSLPASWTSTAYSLERLAFMAKDTLLVIDDYAPQSDAYQSRRLESKAEFIVRSVGNRSGRGRLASDLSQRPAYPPRGIVLSTGEQVLDGTSIRSRMYPIEMRPGDVDLERLTASQAEADRLPHAMAGYLGWLAGEWDYLARTLPQAVKEQRTRLCQDMAGSHLRIPDELAKLYLGLDLGLAYAIEVGALTEEAAQEWRERGWEALREGAEAHTRWMDERQPTVLFLEILGSLLAQGQIHLNQRDGVGIAGGNTYGAELMGWYDEQFVYLLPEPSYNRVCRFMRDEGRHFPVTSDTLRKGLTEDGYLMRHREKKGEGEISRATGTVRVKDETPRALWLYRARVEPFFSLPPVKEDDDDQDPEPIPF